MSERYNRRFVAGRGGGSVFVPLSSPPKEGHGSSQACHPPTFHCSGVNVAYHPLAEETIRRTLYDTGVAESAIPPKKFYENHPHSPPPAMRSFDGDYSPRSVYEHDATVSRLHPALVSPDGSYLRPTRTLQTSFLPDSFHGRRVSLDTQDEWISGAAVDHQGHRRPKGVTRCVAGINRYPCKARSGVDTRSHNSETAYIEVPPNTPHGTPLRCCHEQCARRGYRYRYCMQCGPMDWRNFKKRHSHGMKLSKMKPARRSGLHKGQPVIVKPLPPPIMEQRTCSTCAHDPYSKVSPPAFATSACPPNVALPSPPNVVLPSPPNVVLPSPPNVVLPSPTSVVLPSPSNTVVPSPPNAVLLSTPRNPVAVEVDNQDRNVDPWDEAPWKEAIPQGECRVEARKKTNEPLASAGALIQDILADSGTHPLEVTPPVFEFSKDWLDSNTHDDDDISWTSDLISLSAIHG